MASVKIFLIRFSIVLLTVLVLLVAFYNVINSEIFQFAGDIIPRVETSEKIVALTFDDGPNEQADTILGTLHEEQVIATFYLIGEDIEKNNSEAMKIVQAGHEIGNHSYSHQRMVLKSRNFYAQEIEKTNQLIRDLGYQGSITFRPPYGKKFIGLPLVLKEKKIKTITWDIDPLKALAANASKDEIVEYVSSSTQPGSIILIHPWYGEENESREAVAEIIDELKSKGYRFVTVSELISK